MITERATPPRLQLLRGKTLGRSFELDRDATILGRDPSCDIILRRKIVSTRHCRIVRRGEGFYLEDLGGVGGTLVNGQALRGHARLRDGDLIQLGDYLFRYSGSAFEIRDEDESPSAILGMLDSDEATGLQLAVGRTEVKLRALLEIGQELAGERDLDGVLETVLDALFRIFPQADRGFVLLKNERSEDLAPRAFKTRDDDLGNVIISRTIFDHVMGEGRAILSLDVLSDRRFRSSRSARPPGSAR